MNRRGWGRGWGRGRSRGCGRGRGRGWGRGLGRGRGRGLGRGCGRGRGRGRGCGRGRGNKKKEKERRKMVVSEKELNNLRNMIIVLNTPNEFRVAHIWLEPKEEGFDAISQSNLIYHFAAAPVYSTENYAWAAAGQMLNLVSKVHGCVSEGINKVITTTTFPNLSEDIINGWGGKGKKENG